MNRFFLKFLDNFIYNYLAKNVDKMPMRFVKFIGSYYTDARIRKLYLKRLGLEMGDGTFANPELNVITDHPERISVKVGRNVSIARGVTFIADSSPNNSELLSSNEFVKNKLIKQSFINVEDDVWIGTNVTVLPGVTLKKGSVIGSGAVVTKDTEEFGVYAGIPAKLLYNIKDKQPSTIYPADRRQW